ncbi:5-dehydro-2-deoxygluconokinase [Pseudovibrio sp. Ad46]|uniref:5-dehydro-2-deoxygluconokinase n=1 Tax=unclassified Pseudovibrio TaxID=2627060 RepID=UPI00070DCA6D|nr:MULTISPECIES: 5-dehydro-2-deoxygluconokinase [unclassified Pseudovibrio]KZK78866.1 5-dehydro-2-deoxygluconokinase [Pseudovibrio sp. Ad46]KZK93658.1 5-dehydro-2-deoxygluconokinase [Pseudovibrio sp. Ad5]
MNRLLQQLQGKRYLVVGRAGMDLTPEPAGTSIEDAQTMSVHLGGSAANIAVALRRQECHVSLLTRVSDDAIGRYCVNQLERYGIVHKYVTPIGGEYRNSLALSEARLLDHQTTIYRNGAADFMMSEADVDAVDFSQFDAIVTTGTLLASEPSRTATFYALEKAKAEGLVSIFDIDYRPYSWASAQEATETYKRMSSLCDVIVGNDEEFGFMAGNMANGPKFAHELANRSDCICIYKMGSKGSTTYTENESFQTGIFTVSAVKPTGAGDAFLGGFLSSLSNGKTLQQSVFRGSACAAIVVSKVGCATAMPDEKELVRFLKQHSISVEETLSLTKD